MYNVFKKYTLKHLSIIMLLDAPNRVWPTKRCDNLLETGLVYTRMPPSPSKK